MKNIGLMIGNLNKIGISLNWESRFPKLVLWLFLQELATGLLPVIIGQYINVLSGANASVPPLILVVVVLLFLNYFQFQSQKNENQFFRQIEQSIQKSFLSQITKMSPGTIDFFQESKLEVSFFRDANLIASFANVFVPVLVSSVIQFIMALYVSFVNAWQIGLCVLCFIPLNLFTLWHSRKSLKVCNEKFQSKTDILYQRLFSIIALFTQLKSMAAEERFCKDIYQALNESRKAGDELDFVQNCFRTRIVGNLAIGQILILTVSGFMASNDWIKVGDVVTNQMLFMQAIGSTTAIFNIMPRLEMAKVAYRSLIKLFIEVPVEKIHTDITLSINYGKVEVNNVYFKYPGTSNSVLTNFSAIFYGGACNILTGDNGRGKSTLLKLITGYMQPQKGHIMIDGFDLSQIDILQFREQIAIVQQDPFLINSTFRDNITLRKHYSDKEIQHVIQLVGLTPVVEKLPNGFDTELGRGSVSLSGGEKQRLAIARALIRKPKLAIFDEITNHLDAISCERMKLIIGELQSKCTLILVSHDPEIIKLGQHYIDMNQNV